MSVKLARYVFRKIHGRIIPIRQGLKMAGEEVNRIAEHVVPPLAKNKKVFGNRVKSFTLPSLGSARDPGKALSKTQKLMLGRGVDFSVFEIPGTEHVMKLPNKNPGRQIKGKKLLKMFPHLNDKVARSEALAAHLPNWGVQTVETSSTRISKAYKALIQEKISSESHLPINTQGKWDAHRDNKFHINREAENLAKKSGLDIDAHSGNVTIHGLRDTGLGKLPKLETVTSGSVGQRPIFGRVNEIGDPAIARELLGHVKDFVKPDTITARAAFESPSRKAVNQINKLRKSGYRFKQATATPSWHIEQGEYKLVSPAERIEAAKARGISFKKIGGKLVPVRKK